MFGQQNNENYAKRIVDGLQGGAGEIEIEIAQNPHTDPEVFEYGYLIVPECASIGIHEHTMERESWKVVKGNVIYYEDDNNPVNIGPGTEKVCHKGHKHGLVNLGNCTAVILFTKFK